MILDFLDSILGSRWWDLLVVRFGLGAGALGLITLGLTWFTKRKERGRKLVDEARPELAPLGNLTPRGQFCLRVENRGPGSAHNVRLRFTGTPGEAAGGEVAAKTTGTTPTLDVSVNPALHTAQPGLALTVICADRFGIDYGVSVPVTQTPRADGGFNLDIPNWQGVRKPTNPGSWRYFGIGK